ncbi:ABC-2 type transport system permease protein [Stackebrandtia albiflava]|uniref:ABC-2 type transport system permease protein n=1 Tax=Stackebrandtia albiflava TaxID=406432 RepID=A0A562VCU8_9ACTN|nr:ABC transporter permease [Stackebrandtia albiflava]TWJ15723.1 ABC-2 type transport system permease protein [Stackebrandtia albiflava]
MTDTDTRFRRTPGWLVVAGNELRLIMRNKTVAVTATLVPLAMIVVMSLGDGDGSPGMAAMHLVMLLGFSVYATTTMALAHRRAAMFLKRLRASPVPSMGIVAGLACGPVLLFFAQSGLLAAGHAVAGDMPPRDPAVLAAAVVTGAVTCAALAFLTASFTNTPEAAQLTTMPGFMVLIGGMLWVLNTPADEVTAVQLAIPGGAVTQLARAGFTTPGEIAAVPGVWSPVLAAVVVSTVCCLLAARLFRWEPRS